MEILIRTEELAGSKGNPRDRATLDCMWMAFYFLLQPGEYTNASGDAKHPFRLEDVEFKIGTQHFSDVRTASIADLTAGTFTSIKFSTQKNGVKGEKLAHVSNMQLFACQM